MASRIPLVLGTLGLMAALIPAQRRDSGESATELGCFRRSTQNGQVDICYSVYQSATGGQRAHQQAIGACQTKPNGRLARIPDTAAQTWLETALNSVNSFSRRQLWIGAKFTGSGWTWHGDEDKVLMFTNWASGQPRSGANRCAYLSKSRSSWKWYTDSCELRIDFLCEYAIVEQHCGRPEVQPAVSGVERMIGGKIAIPHSWPWMVSLQINGRGRCGGTLIDDHWVLTAAHCYEDMIRYRDRSVAIGFHNLQQPSNNSFYRRITSMIKFPEYNASTLSNDIMLLELDSPVAFSHAVNPVCLPPHNESSNDLRSGRRCYAMGWGMSNDTTHCCPLWIAKRDTRGSGTGEVVFTANTLSDCQFECYSRNSCVAVNFRYNNESSSACNLVLSSPSNPRSVVEQTTYGVDYYAVNRDPRCAGCKLAWTLYEHQSVMGNVIKASDASSLEECKQDCFNEDRCKSFTYPRREQESQRCILLSELSREDMEQSSYTDHYVLDRQFFDEDVDSVLKQVELPIYERRLCRRAYSGGERPLNVDETMFCAGRLSGGADTCNGDSGGPLVCREEDGRWVQFGITSWGSNNCGERNKPAVFTIVSRYRDWIDQTVRGLADISYNFLIDGNGNVYEGRGWNYVGFHTPLWNSQSVGIAFIGNFMSTLPSGRALDALRDLLECGVMLGKVSNTYSLHGHRDGMCTFSPGDALYNEIKTWTRYGGKLSTSC